MPPSPLTFLSTHQPLSVRCQKHIYLDTHNFFCSIFFSPLHCDLPTGIWLIFSVVSANFCWCLFFPYFTFLYWNGTDSLSHLILSSNSVKLYTACQRIVVVTLMPCPSVVVEFSFNILFDIYKYCLYHIIWRKRNEYEKTWCMDFLYILWCTRFRLN